MPFPFVYICDLLEKLAELVHRDVPMLTKALEKETNKRTLDWLLQHRKSLNDFSTDDQAVLSTFRPEQRMDRDYGLDAGRLEQLIARVLNLPRNLYVELQMWRREPRQGDLAFNVEQVMEKLTLVRRFTVLSNPLRTPGLVRFQL
jgi:hypothetical protein